MLMFTQHCVRHNICFERLQISPSFQLLKVLAVAVVLSVRSMLASSALLVAAVV